MCDKIYLDNCKDVPKGNLYMKAFMLGCNYWASHAGTETKYYADISHKPCLVEEIGTLGNMMCDEQTAAGFLRVVKE